MLEGGDGWGAGSRREGSAVRMGRRISGKEDGKTGRIWEQKRKIEKGGGEVDIKWKYEEGRNYRRGAGRGSGSAREAGRRRDGGGASPEGKSLHKIRPYHKRVINFMTHKSLFFSQVVNTRQKIALFVVVDG